MTTRGGTLHAADPADVHVGARELPPARLPLVVYVLALGTFLMGTTEFVVAGLLPEIAGDVQVSVARAGLMITVFAVGMIVGAPLMAMLTLRLPRRQTLVIALGVFAVGHVVVALGSQLRPAAGRAVPDRFGDRSVLVGGQCGGRPRSSPCWGCSDSARTRYSSPSGCVSRVRRPLWGPR
ncbi:MFS transporter [Streptomyces sp. NPDC054962]